MRKRHLCRKIQIVEVHLPDGGKYNSLLVECGLCRVTLSKSTCGKGRESDHPLQQTEHFLVWRSRPTTVNSHNDHRSTGDNTTPLALCPSSSNMKPMWGHEKEGDEFHLRYLLQNS